MNPVSSWQKCLMQILPPWFRQRCSTTIRSISDIMTATSCATAKADCGSCLWKGMPFKGEKPSANCLPICFIIRRKYLSIRFVRLFLQTVIWNSSGSSLYYSTVIWVRTSSKNTATRSTESRYRVPMNTTLSALLTNVSWITIRHTTWDMPCKIIC